MRDGFCSQIDRFEATCLQRCGELREAPWNGSSVRVNNDYQRRRVICLSPSKPPDLLSIVLANPLLAGAIPTADRIEPHLARVESGSVEKSPNELSLPHVFNKDNHPGRLSHSPTLGQSTPTVVNPDRPQIAQSAQSRSLRERSANRSRSPIGREAPDGE